MDYSGVTVPIAQSHTTLGTAIHTACNHQGLQHCNCHSTQRPKAVVQLTIFIKEHSHVFVFIYRKREFVSILVAILSQEIPSRWLGRLTAKSLQHASHYPLPCWAATVQVAHPTSRSRKCVDNCGKPHQLSRPQTLLFWNKSLVNVMVEQTKPRLIDWL